MMKTIRVPQFFNDLNFQLRDVQSERSETDYLFQKLIIRSLLRLPLPTTKDSEILSLPLLLIRARIY